MLLGGALILMISLLMSCFTGTLKSRGTLVADIGMTFDELMLQIDALRCGRPNA